MFGHDSPVLNAVLSAAQRLGHQTHAPQVGGLAGPNQPHLGGPGAQGTPGDPRLHRGEPRTAVGSGFLGGVGQTVQNGMSVGNPNQSLELGHIPGGNRGFVQDPNSLTGWDFASGGQIQHGVQAPGSSNQILNTHGQIIQHAHHPAPHLGSPAAIPGNGTGAAAIGGGAAPAPTAAPFTQGTIPVSPYLGGNMATNPNVPPTYQSYLNGGAVPATLQPMFSQLLNSVYPTH